MPTSLDKWAHNYHICCVVSSKVLSKSALLISFHLRPRQLSIFRRQARALEISWRVLCTHAPGIRPSTHLSDVLHLDLIMSSITLHSLDASRASYYALASVAATSGLAWLLLRSRPYVHEIGRKSVSPPGPKRKFLLGNSHNFPGTHWFKNFTEMQKEYG